MKKVIKKLFSATIPVFTVLTLVPDLAFGKSSPQDTLVSSFAQRDKLALKGSLFKGSGNINGTERQLFTLQGYETSIALQEDLKRVFQGKFTVQMHKTPMGDILVVVDMQSRECPKCKKWPVQEYENAFRKAMFITAYNTGKSVLGVVSLNNAPIKAQKNLAYLGEHLKSFTKPLKITTSAKLAFGKAKVLSITANSVESIETLFKDCKAELASHGFKSLLPERKFNEKQSGMAIMQLTGTWVLNKRVIRVAVTRLPENKQSMVTINEVESQENG